MIQATFTSLLPSAGCVDMLLGARETTHLVDSLRHTDTDDCTKPECTAADSVPQCSTPYGEIRLSRTAQCTMRSLMSDSCSKAQLTIHLQTLSLMRSPSAVTVRLSLPQLHSLYSRLHRIPVHHDALDDGHLDHFVLSRSGRTASYHLSTAAELELFSLRGRSCEVCSG